MVSSEAPSFGVSFRCSGPNGAGKSTALKLLAGLLTATSGSVTVAVLNPQDAKQTLGVKPENLGLFDEPTVEEHLLLTADIYNAPKTRIIAPSERPVRSLGCSF